MPRFSPEMIRTIALAGHGGSGKTTLAEALLAKAGAINSPGSVEKGTTVCDFDPLEKQYQHSLNAAVVHFQHRRHARAPGRHPGPARLHRARDRRAAGGGNRGDRGQRPERHRDDHQPHDAVGEKARSLPHDHRQQDRRRERGPAGCAGEAAGCLRQGMPADQPAGRRRQARGGLLLQSFRRGGFLLGGGGAQRAGGPGGRGGRGTDGEISREGRSSAGSSCTRRSRRRCARAT